MRVSVFGMLVCMLALGSCSAGRVSIDATEQEFTITAPESSVELVVPRGVLGLNAAVYGGPTNSPRYFSFGGPSLVDSVNLSGWFEPAERYVDLDQSFRHEVQGLRSDGLRVMNIEHMTELPWLGLIRYTISKWDGVGAHIKASYLDQHTWIDLHASVTSESSEEAQATVLALVRSLRIREK